MKNIWYDSFGVIQLENEQMSAAFDRQNGSLVAFENKKMGWKIQEDHLSSQSFRKASHLEQLLLRWNGVQIVVS